MADYIKKLAVLHGTALELLVAEPNHTQNLSSNVRDYQSLLNRYPGVYLLGHSQGSLFVNDAFYILSQNELRPGQKARSASGGFFVAPAASGMHGDFVNDYTKFYSDTLAPLGLRGNVKLFDSKIEKDAFLAAHEDVDSEHHGFLTSYFNKNYVTTSPAHARSYNRIVHQVTNDLRRLTPECEAVWTIGLNNTADVYAADPRGIRDAWACKMEAYRRGRADALAWSRLQCVLGFGLNVTSTPDHEGKPRTINWRDECTEDGDKLHCGVQLFDSTGTHSYGQTYERVMRDSKCAADRYAVVDAFTNEESCLTWEAMFFRMQPG